MAALDTEPVPVEYYYDYNCPFCYIGSERLDRVVRAYPVAVHYRPIEIHPDNPPEGRPLSELGYSASEWQRMDASLKEMAAAEGIALAERTFTPNSRGALLLAQAVLKERPRAFRGLHRALFQAYLVSAQNLGDPRVLWAIAEYHGVGDLLTAATQSPEATTALLENVEAAQQLGLTGVPTLVVGGRSFSGAVSIETLQSALERDGVVPYEH